MRTLGGMEIFGEISAGGMGSVFLARKTGAHGFEKIVAVKTIRAELADREDIRRLFLDEARLAARIEHPAVAQVYEFGEDDGALFLAMEYLQGVSLEALLDKLGVVPAGVAARIGAGVCRGLHAAHEATGSDGRRLGVVHRDVSPPNVMLTFDGGVKILDFGIALMRNRRAPDTHVGRLRGKLAYMAPEQVLGGAIDRRTDIYGVANVLYEITTGAKLRGELAPHELAAAFDLPVPRARLRGVPEVLEVIITRGLARDPQERFADARAMAIALESAAAELGSESLEEFAQRTLAAEQAAHRALIAELSGGGQVTAKKSRGPTLVASGATRAPPAIAVPPSELARVGERRSRLVPRSESSDPVAPGLVAPARAAPLAPFGHSRSRMARIAIGAACVLAVAAVPWWRSNGQVPVSAQIAPPAALLLPVPRPPPRPLAPPLSVTVHPVPEIKTRVRRSHVQKTVEEKREPGFLTVGAHPYALVLVDGRELGLTPLLKLPLDAGSHQLTLLDPSSRGVRASEEIDIRPEAVTSRLYR